MTLSEGWKVIFYFYAATAVFSAIIAWKRVPAEQTIIFDMIGTNQRGTGYGVYMFATGIGSIGGPIIGGLLYDKFSHTAPFIVCGIILVLCSVLTLLMFGSNIRSNIKKTFA